MIRVLHLINSLDLGGGERFAVDVIRRFNRKDFDPYVVCLYRAGELRDHLSALEIPVRVLALDRKLKPSSMRKVLNVLREVQPQVVHTHLPESCWYGLPAAWRAHVPVRIGHVQNTHRRWSNKVRLLDRVASSFATGIIACSEAVRSFCEGEIRYRPGKTRVIHNAVDVRRFVELPSPEEARRALGLPQDSAILVCVASLTTQKGHESLLIAMARILAAFPATTLVLVGEGPCRSSLTQLASELGLSGSIRFLGARTDIPIILAASDLFVLPSLWEGFGLVLAEAGAAGLPVVATRVDGILEVIEEGKTGFLVKPNKPRELADAVVALLENRERARVMGMRARERVGERFDIDAAVRKVEDLYREGVRRARVK
jgi:glycosyltransferase involved in cell wall biosynthesis